MSKERRVFSYEVGGGFQPIREEEAPVISRETKNQQATQSGEERNTGDNSGQTTSVDGTLDTPPVIPKPANSDVDDQKGTNIPTDNPLPDNPRADNTGSDTGNQGTEAGQYNEEIPIKKEGEGEGEEGASGNLTGEDNNGDGGQEPQSGEGSENVGEGLDGSGEPIVTDNFFVVASERLKQNGFLPEEFELEPELSDEEADLKLYNAYIESLKPQANQELLREFQSEISKRGWDEQTLTYAEMLRNNVSPQEISVAVNYDTLSSLDVEKMTPEDKINYASKMYEDRGWKEKEIKRTLATAEVDDEVDELVIETKEYFKNKKIQVDTINKQKAAENARQIEKINQYNQSIVSNLFNNGEIGGEKVTGEQLDVFEQALYEKNIPVQFEDGIRNMSAFEQFDHAIKNDFGVRLWAFKKFLFKEDDLDNIKREAEKAAEEKYNVRFGKRSTKISKSPDSEVSSSGSKMTTNKKSYRKSQTGGNSFVFEQGEFKNIAKQ